MGAVSPVRSPWAARPPEALRHNRAWQWGDRSLCPRQPVPRPQFIVPATRGAGGWDCCPGGGCGEGVAGWCCRQPWVLCCADAAPVGGCERCGRCCECRCRAFVPRLVNSSSRLASQQGTAPPCAATTTLTEPVGTIIARSPARVIYDRRRRCRRRARPAASAAARPIAAGLALLSLEHGLVVVAGDRSGYVVRPKLHGPGVPCQRQGSIGEPRAKAAQRSQVKPHILSLQPSPRQPPHPGPAPPFTR